MEQLDLANSHMKHTLLSYTALEMEQSFSQM